jgi:cyanamide hydratase
MPSIPADVHCWTAVPQSVEKFLASSNAANTKPYNVSDLDTPFSKVAQKTLAYAKEYLLEPTFNHSMRVFFYGKLTSGRREHVLLIRFRNGTSKNHAPSNAQAEPGIVETFFLSYMLHDIGTVPENIKSTRLTFELWGSIHVLQLLPSFGASKDQAECVAEVINRYQDLGDIGMAPLVLGLIYFATIFGL